MAIVGSKRYNQEMTRSAEPLLSIVIVNYETPEHTLNCIRSIEEFAPHWPYEVIVIDNGSADGSLQKIRSGAPQVMCIEMGKNAGFSKANNLGINNSRGRYILLLNSDTKIVEPSLGRMVSFMEENPAVGALGPRQIDGEGNLQLSWGHFPTLFHELVRKLFHHRLSINDQHVRDYLEEKYSGSCEVDWLSGSCLLARREALFDASLLDENFFMYFEDIDLCRRIQDQGWKNYYLSETTVLHYGGVSSKKNLLRALLRYRGSQLYFTKKYYGLKGVWILKALLFMKASFNFTRWGVLYLRDILMRRDREQNFARLLLTKKTMEIVFTETYRPEEISEH